MTVWFHNAALEKGIPDDGATFKALQRTLQRRKKCGFPLSIKKLSGRGGAIVTESTSDIGILLWLDGLHEEFVDSLTYLYGKGLRRFVLFAPITDLTRLWRELPGSFGVLFGTSVPTCVDVTPRNLNHFFEMVARGAQANPRLELAVMARRIHCLLADFGHNKENDLSNQLLAPARLLILGGHQMFVGREKRSRALWNRFTKRVLDKLDPEHGSLGDELRRSAAPIAKWINHGPRPTAVDLGAFMTLLTTIRLDAWKRTSVDGLVGADSEVHPVSAFDPALPSIFRILVVDDHASWWRPVFEKLAQTLARNGKSVCFEFSSDGKNARISRGTKPSRVFFGFYDLIILDIFLRCSDGREVLRSIRRDFSQLPVLLWTTSRDEEIIADATLANGVLLKKTISWKAFEEAVGSWVERGHSLRTRSLPNPFFNHTVVNTGYRDLAVRFHEWCLKQLDSFHALDGSFFRYFTDHGGRHIVKLWELLEQALQPFVNDENAGLLPEDVATRQLEIVGLYLTVICHELGMFPMRYDGRVEDFAHAGPHYLQYVRTLHAARGMLLIEGSSKHHKSENGYWNDANGRLLGNDLQVTANRTGPDLASRVATLVGYHARLFRSLKPNEFLKLNSDATKKIEATVKKVEDPAAPHLKHTGTLVRAAIQRLDGVFTDPQLRERLRRQCALFRFVDAMDISASRNPAEFLIGSNVLSARSYVENFKRELCCQAFISRGEVIVELTARRPGFGLLKKIIGFLGRLDWSKEKDLMLVPQINRARSFLERSKEAQNHLKNPWDLRLCTRGSLETKLTALQESVLCLYNPLDHWLEKLWGLGAKVDDNFVKHLKSIHVLDSRVKRLRFGKNGPALIASIAGLCVVGELLDEYQAIIDAEIDGELKLGACTWSSRPVSIKTSVALAALEKKLRADTVN